MPAAAAAAGLVQGTAQRTFEDVAHCQLHLVLHVPHAALQLCEAVVEQRVHVARLARPLDLRACRAE